MATVKESESRLVFIIDKTLHNNFRVRAAEDKLSQKAFIQGVLQAYVDDDSNIVEFVQRLTGLAQKNSEKQNRNLKKAEEVMKRFTPFDSDELDNIFDVIARENPEI
tara:strand:- start:622 stop:942 length:321 start_codon:yes stop_codon:yes gene_type:complete